MNNHSPSLIIFLIPVVVVAAFLAGGIIYLRKKGYAKGGGEKVIVQCTGGHLFTTVWVPLVSFKAIRLGPVRFQFCPVGNHWAIVSPVNPSTLTEEERAFASTHHDSFIV